MNELAVAVLAATEAQPDASGGTDYTPAFIGLAGVVLGGIIQVWYQAKQARKQARQQIRTQVAQYAANTGMLLDHLEELVIDYEAHMENEDYLAPNARQAAFDRIRELLPVVHGQHSSLVACPDSRLSRQAMIASNKLVAEVIPAWIAITTEGDLDRNRFDEGSKQMRKLRLIIVGMVAPSPKEKMRDFRSAESAEEKINSGF